MLKFLTEDEVRDNNKKILDFYNVFEQNVQQGTGQLTTFNQLGFKGVSDKPDGWYIPTNKNAVAIILEIKNSAVDWDTKLMLMKFVRTCTILMADGYKNVVGILHNGYKARGFLNNEPIDIPN